MEKSVESTWAVIWSSLKRADNLTCHLNARLWDILMGSFHKYHQVAPVSSSVWSHWMTDNCWTDSYCGPYKEPASPFTKFTHTCTHAYLQGVNGNLDWVQGEQLSANYVFSKRISISGNVSFSTFYCTEYFDKCLKSSQWLANSIFCLKSISPPQTLRWWCVRAVGVQLLLPRVSQSEWVGLFSSWMQSTFINFPLWCHVF